MWNFGHYDGWDCGPEGNFWGQHTMGCLPKEVADACDGKLAFVSMTCSDGRRLTKKFCDGRDVIVLSERIVPQAGLSEAAAAVRYFMFVIMHEIAHAYREHRPPNEISPEENEAQEQEANALAFQWMNDAIRSRQSPHLHEFTQEELEGIQAQTRAAMEAARGR
ncbi:ImmA/IrrE family metallo-endopeptidase [Burkholderia anthina]|uniref:ImmA/IrrE family metallo-endopeptidase n=1 Tax=Burkholderia anthina TaxID=179879 RepID=UPI00158BE514|nr:ImmA/IrrE family metallo-endopeptidase [Burkholderia anthina]